MEVVLRNIGENEFEDEVEVNGEGEYPIFKIYQSDEEILKFLEKNPSNIFGFEPLYKKNLNSKPQEWKIRYYRDLHQIESVHGQVGGKMQYKKKDITINQSGRDYDEQALLRMRKKYNDKYDLNYRPIGEPPNEKGNPMLASKWVPPMKGKKENPILNYPVMVQAKLDGIRCLASEDGGEIVYRSRTSKIFPFAPKYFNEEVRAILRFLPPNVELDGEMYIPGINFQKFTSIFTREKSEHPMYKDCTYNIFDFNTSELLTYEQRYSLLFSAFRNYFSTRGETLKINLLFSSLSYSPEETMEFHDDYVEQGYEGIIIRKLGGFQPDETRVKESIYRNGRCKNLLKYTLWIEEETEVVDVLEGEGKAKGMAIFVVKNIRYPEESNVETFKVVPAAPEDERKRYFSHPEEVMGIPYTIRYKSITDDGVPSKAVGKAFRTYE